MKPAKSSSRNLRFMFDLAHSFIASPLNSVHYLRTSIDVMPDYDLIVIGGGPAGYVGAIRAGAAFKKVACVEMDRAGGTFINWE